MLTRLISTAALSLEPFSNLKLVLSILLWLAGIALLAFAIGMVRMRRQRDQARLDMLQLQTALASLRSSTEFRTELLAVAAHDLRGATGMCRSLADLIARDSQTPARLAEVASTIVATTSHMEQMVYRLLERVAAQDEDWTVTPVRFDLAKLVDQTAVSWRPDAKRKDIALAASAAESLAVVLDPMLTAEILTNLVSNAVKFTPNGGRVGLELTAGDDSVFLRVIDTGPGISRKERPRLFRPFHPLSARPTGGEPSTGLGLAIAKRLAELQRGDLDLERSDESGTVFLLTLPRWLATDPERPSASSREVAA